MREVLGHRCPFPTLATKIAVNKGRHLYHQGDLVEGAYSLATGLVALERVDENGELVILKILHRGAFFPCADLLGSGTHESAGRALTDVTGCFVPAERLNAALHEDPSMGLALLKLSSAEIRENEDAIFRLCSTDLPDRVLSTLNSLANESGERASNGDLSLTLPISWRDLAAMVGTGPEVISRLLRRLAGSGRLSFRGRHVTLHAANSRQGTPPSYS
ncbi:transcriptional regulator Crp/Fnr family [Paramagnetospirillum magnetotacticum MS-1]|uniref:Transcriptional regulator Crp/Fnr family n=1 Tax=Paramagnetospirillum magnetotacticum MS-1 TaxID=272627 RepID=A0A0C2YKC3_PARME|nr:Crp/Fnr family transcriptional regulator [Paramagnetospirillum magnetotacticum]KIM00215.1 transcriptional regulator Crp/Fnr family [Paramagnetospirillum magnetotacticum MS-1]